MIMAKLDTLDTILLIEGGEGDEDSIIEAWQLQGFYGRGAKQLIENGICEAASPERLRENLNVKC
jgi:hypothetical protein